MLLLYSRITALAMKHVMCLFQTGVPERTSQFDRSLAPTLEQPLELASIVGAASWRAIGATPFRGRLWSGPFALRGRAGPRPWSPWQQLGARRAG